MEPEEEKEGADDVDIESSSGHTLSPLWNYSDDDLASTVAPDGIGDDTSDDLTFNYNIAFSCGHLFGTACTVLTSCISLSAPQRFVQWWARLRCATCASG